MEKFNESIKLLSSKLDLTKYLDVINNKDYEILEDSDMFGFSCLHSINRSNLNNRPNVFNSFKNDENWLNPESVSLMMKSFEISDPYATFRFKASNQAQIEKDKLGLHEVKYLHDKFLVDQLYLQANQLFQEGKMSDCLSKLNEAISFEPHDNQVYFLRSNTYLRLHLYPEAHADALKAVDLDPKCEASKRLLQSIENSDFFKQNSAKEQSTLHGTITKLKLSLLSSNLAKRARDFIYSSDESSSSSNDMNSEEKQSKSKKHKREKKHKKSKKHKKRKKNDD